MLLPWRVLTWCIGPTRVGTAGSCIAFEEDSPGVLLFFPQEEHSSNAGPTRAVRCLGGWHCQVLEVFALGPW